MLRLTCITSAAELTGITEAFSGEYTMRALDEDEIELSVRVDDPWPIVSMVTPLKIASMTMAITTADFRDNIAIGLQ